MSKVNIYICVCFLIVALDAAATLFSYKVRETQNQVENSSSIVECRKRKDDATLQVTGAVILLIASHLAINLLSAFSCFTKGELPEVLGCRKPSVVCLILTWLIFGVAEAMVVFGTKSNEKSLCRFTYRRRVMIGGILSIFHALFGIATYFTSAVFHHKIAS